PASTSSRYQLIFSAQDPGVAQRVTAGLRPHAQPVRPGADRDGGNHVAVVGADGIDDSVVPPGHPQDSAVGGQVAHVRATATGDPPFGGHLAGCQIEDGDRTFTAVGDEQPGRCAVDVQPVRAPAGRDEI